MSVWKYSSVCYKLGLTRLLKICKELTTHGVERYNLYIFILLGRFKTGSMGFKIYHYDENDTERKNI